jgi:quinol monooxygenase YgiN
MYVITARWFIKSSREKVLRALKELARKVQSTEPDTWTYRVHTAAAGSLPPCSRNEVLFFEVYKNKKAFLAHVQGKAFTDFTRRYGKFFVPDLKAGPFVLVERLEPVAGFDREQGLG